MCGSATRADRIAAADPDAVRLEPEDLGDGEHLVPHRARLLGLDDLAAPNTQGPRLDAHRGEGALADELLNRRPGTCVVGHGEPRELDRGQALAGARRGLRFEGFEGCPLHRRRRSEGPQERKDDPLELGVSAPGGAPLELAQRVYRGRVRLELDTHRLLEGLRHRLPFLRFEQGDEGLGREQVGR